MIFASSYVMKNKSVKYSHLTVKEILSLRGKPFAKMVGECQNWLSPHTEEWIYYNTITNTKESYVFKNENLIGYSTETVKGYK